MGTEDDKVCKNYFYILELKCSVVEKIIALWIQDFDFTFAPRYSTLNSC